MNQFIGSYSKCPYIEDVISILEGVYLLSNQTVSQLNIRLIESICRYLNISTILKLSRSYCLQGAKTARLIDLLQKVGATSYLSGPAAKAYLDEEAFRQAGIGLTYKNYSYEPYPQQWGKFEGAVTVLDLIANCGPDAVNHLRSLESDEEVFP